jgi:hypothetical protein
LVVFYALAVLSGQVHEEFPRRFGYIPYTIGSMILIAFLAQPGIRHLVGFIPALVAVLTLACLWITLQAVCLPIIRSQDERVWAAARAALAEKHEPSILFVNAWNHPDMPGYRLWVGTPGLRGSGFPQIFESPLSSYWWQSLYAITVLRARFAAYRAILLDPERLRLFSHGLLRQDSIDVLKDSVIVMADPGLTPPDWKTSLEGVIIFTQWDAFQTSAANVAWKHKQ